MPADAFTAGQFAWDARLLTASATTGLVRPVHGARVLRGGGAVARLRRAPRRKMLLVFGCIGTDFCKKIRVLQHFSNSTQLSS